MDQDRFDQLTRALGSGRSRRGVLKALGAALGALAGVAGRDEAGANPPPKKCKYQGSNCSGNADCCTLNCCNRTCCGDGQICTNGQCVFPTTTPAPTTTTTPTPTTTTTTTPKPDLCATVTCTALDQCHGAGVCDPATGQCSNPALPDTTPCNDGNACTTGDQCFSGICKGTGAVKCPPNAACDPGSGACICAAGLTPCASGCADTKSDANNCGGCGNVCTGGDECNAPICSGGGCTTAPTNDGGPCKGGTGTCSGGACVPNGSTCGNCFTTGHGPGCSNSACQAAVCGVDSYCCSTDFDQTCVTEATTYCTC